MIINIAVNLSQAVEELLCAESGDNAAQAWHNKSAGDG